MMQTLLDRVINSTNKALKETNKDLQFEVNTEHRVTRPISLNHQMHILRVVPTYNLVKQNNKLIDTLTEIIALNLED